MVEQVVQQGTNDRDSLANTFATLLIQEDAKQRAADKAAETAATTATTDDKSNTGTNKADRGAVITGQQCQ